MVPQTVLLSLLLASTFNVVLSGQAYSDVAVFNRRSLKVGENESPIASALWDSFGKSVANAYEVTGPVSVIKPCCVSWGPGRVDCFIRDRTSSILHWSKQDGVANGWERLDGIYAKNVECISRQKGSIDVFAVKHDGSANVNSVDGFTNVWSGWKSMAAGRLMEAPSCVARTQTEIDCVGRGLGNKVYTIDFKGGKWNKWVYRGTATRSACKCSHRTESITDFMCVAHSSTLSQASTFGSKWIAWTDQGGRLSGQPEVKSFDEYDINVLGVSEKNQLVYLKWNGKWQKWVSLGRMIVDAPSCVVLGGSLHCFMVALDLLLYRRSLEGTTWSGWIYLGGSYIEGPSCVLSDPKKKEISCYLRGLDRRIGEKVFTF